MKKQRFGTLLAITTLASATPAFAHPSRPPAPVATSAPHGGPAATTHVPAAIQHFVQSLAVLVGRASIQPVPRPVVQAVARPRELPNGAPACGNVSAKSRPKPCR